MKSFEKSRKTHHDLRNRIKWDFAKKSIQVARTLDEAYYPSLDQEVLRNRNQDQVVSRECKKLKDGQLVSEDTMPILMVPQFWIWKIEDHILSAYSLPGKNLEPLSGDDLDDDQNYSNHPTRSNTWIPSVENRSVPWQSENIGFSTILVSNNPDLHIGLLLAHIIEKFGEVQANKFQSPLDIFEIGVIQVISRVELFIKKPTSLKPDDIHIEREFIHDIADIRDELAMLGDILSQQTGIFSSIVETIETTRYTTEVEPSHRRTLKNAYEKLRAYRERVKKIDGDAERIEKNIQDQLNLKRTYASIRDARASIRDAHSSVVLGTAVIGFTIVTVIFTPLAFMTSLFALPIDKLVKHQSTEINGTKTFPTNYVGKWFGK